MRKNIVIPFLLLMLLMVMEGFALLFNGGGYSAPAIDKDSIDRNKVTTALENLKTLADDTTAFYCKYHVICHSGGRIEGCDYTNSLEAWKESYAKGNRLMDADMSFTRDGHLVLKHEWNDNLEQTNVPMKDSRLITDPNGSKRYLLSKDTIVDYKTFKSTSIFHRFTPMTVDDMLDFMDSHPDIYVATDFKGSDVLKGYQSLVVAAKRKKMVLELDRIIVSLYDFKLFQKVKQIYPFKNIVMRQYIYEPHNYSELAKFCVDNGIHVVNISKCYVNDPGVKLLMSEGIHVFVAVVDDLGEYKRLRAEGFSGCVSNIIRENELKKLRLN